MKHDSVATLRKELGFTIVELMVVLAIVAVTAAVAIPMYQDYTRKTKAAEAWEELTHIAALQDQIFTDFRQYAVTAERLQAYGANMDGKYFSVVVNNTNVWTAVAAVCFDGRKPCAWDGDYDIRYTINRSGGKFSQWNGGDLKEGWSL